MKYNSHFTIYNLLLKLQTGELRRRREKRRRMALKIFSEPKPFLNFRSARINGKKMAIKIKNVNIKKHSKHDP